jgi:recombination protein RecT
VKDPYEIPWRRLPPTFARGLESDPTDPPAPRPSATIVLMRDGADGPEALLMKRRREAGFVPGAFVFPGGRVDAADADAALAALCDGPAASEPEFPYWVAAVREAFEETGLLLAVADGVPVPPAAASPVVDELRDALLEDRVTLADVLGRLRARVDLSAVAYLARWITPVVEPRRYDTRFFVAAVSPDAVALADPREMVEAVWLSPARALRRFAEGELPMVFPTVRTLEDLKEFDTCADAVAWARTLRVPSRLPRLVKTETGVTIRLGPEDEDEEDR